MLEGSLEQLEKSVAKAVAKLRSAGAGQEALREEIHRLRHSVEELENENRQLKEQLEGYREDRSEIRARLGRIRESMAVLAEPAPEEPSREWLGEE